MLAVFFEVYGYGVKMGVCLRFFGGSDGGV